MWKAYTEMTNKELIVKLGAVCIACRSKKRLSIDHIISRANGGSNELSNLQVLCKPCNSRKHCKNIDFKAGTPSWFFHGLSPRCLHCQLRAIRYDDKLCATCYSFTNHGKDWDGKPQRYRWMVEGEIYYGTIAEREKLKERLTPTLQEK